MSDKLISANKLMDYINSNINAMTKIGVSVDGEYLWELLNYAIEDAPAVEVVQCKDCKDYRRWIDTATEFCAMTECRTTANNFCSWGKRREDEKG